MLFLKLRFEFDQSRTLFGWGMKRKFWFLQWEKKQKQETETLFLNIKLESTYS